jgi:hypothetical protein
MYGMGMVIEHFAAIAEQTANMMWEGTIAAGQETRDLTRKNMLDLGVWDTGDSWRSVHMRAQWAGDIDIVVDVGPTTFYAPFWEYGYGKHQTPRPATNMAFDVMAPIFIAYALEVGKLAGSNAAGRSNIPSPLDEHSTLHRLFGNIRGHLYNDAKLLGDIAVLGGKSFIGPTRARMYGLAQILGDVQASMTGAIGSRASRRLTGKTTGRLIGVGSRTVSVNKIYSAPVGGTAGRRVYTRLAGRHSKFIITRAGVRDF